MDRIFVINGIGIDFYLLLLFYWFKMLNWIAVWSTLLIAVSICDMEVYTQPEQIHLSYGGSYCVVVCFHNMNTYTQWFLR